MNNKAIGIFDSGIGGLMVLKEMIKKIPNEKYIYLGDIKNFPYGEKSKKDIIKYTKNNIKTLLKHDVKLIIIACGTATSQALDEVKKDFDIPIIGIIESTVNYISTLNLDKIGVMATNGTINSKAWEKAIKEKNKKIKVFNLACPMLANLAEKEEINTKKGIQAIHRYTEFFKKNNVNNIILGCTHYPIYDDMIKNEFNGNVNLINTGIFIAKNVEDFLIKNNMQNDSMKITKPQIIITKDEADFSQKAKNILENK